MKEIKIIGINEIFDNRKYKIPIYQRNYAWTNIEIEQLIDDICDAEQEYYLGSLVVDENIENGVYEVIDGQQRLTTIFILFFILNCEYKKNIKIEPESLWFEIREKSNITLKSINEIIYLKEKRMEDYDNGIISGIDCVINYLKGNKNKINKLNLDKIKMLIVPVPENTNLNKYFEIMNTRGEQLEPHQIVKANIMGLFEEEDERNLISIIWDACADMNSYVQMNIHSTELRKKIFGKKWDNCECNSFKDIIKIYKETLKKNNQKVENDKSKSIDDILELNINIDEYKTIIYNEDDKKINFESILSFPNFLLQVAKITNNLIGDIDDNNLDESKLLEKMEPFYNKEAKVNAKKFIYNLLYYRFIFDNYIIKRDKREDKEGKWSLKKLESYKSEKQNSYQPKYDTNRFDNVREIILLQSALRITYTSPKTMHWITRVLMYVNKNMSNKDLKEGLIKELEVYVKERINDAIEIINNNGNYYIQSKDNNKEEINGFKVPRIVFTYLDYLLAIDNNRFKLLDYLKDDKDKGYINNFSFKYRNSIEHFHPQHQNEDQQKDTWKNANDNDEIFMQKINDFGNLALVTVEGNSTLNNASAEAKIKGWENIIKQSPKFVLMAEKAKEEDGWTYEKCVKHRNDMLKILQENIKLD